LTFWQIRDLFHMDLDILANQDLLRFPCDCSDH
jgi:hypothetical protein